MQALEPVSRADIRLTGLDAESPLSYGRAKLVDRDPLCNPVLIAKPVESRTGQQDGVILLFIQFSDACVQIATKIGNVEITPYSQQLRLSPQAAGTHSCSFGKRFKTEIIAGEKRIAHVFAGTDGSQSQTCEAERSASL